MRDPCFPSFWSTPAGPRHEGPKQQRTVGTPSRPAKVVSIPVRFVGSEEEAKQPPAAATARSTEATRSAAAVKIQRVFRGFLVRKNVRTVRRLEDEVDAVERGMKEAGDLLRLDGKERLRVSETLMAVLLQLDSVRGARDYRRRVVGRVISLQEAVDSIMATEGKSLDGGAAGNGGGETLEKGDVSHVTDQTIGDREVTETREEGGEGLAADSTEKTLETLDPTPSTGGDGGESHEEEDSGQDGKEAIPEEETLGAPQQTPLAEEEIRQIEGSAEKEGSTEQSKGAGATPQSQGVTQSADGTIEGENIECDDGTGTPNLTFAATRVGGEDEGQGGGAKDTTEVMESTVEVSKSLEGMVAELCRRNEMQCRLMCGLLRRVEHLERVVESMGRKKKKKRRQATEPRNAEGKL